jgi:hypothetical protein
VRGSIQKNLGRVRDWTLQSWAFLVSPRRFMEEWSTGRRDAMDPLAFLAAGSAVKALLMRYGGKIVPFQLPSNAAEEWISSSLRSTVMLFIFGAMAHLVLRRHSRAPFRSTVAAVAYTLGGPGALIACAAWAVAIALHFLGVDTTVTFFQARVPAPLIVAGHLPHVWTLFALAGVHRVGWRRLALATLAVIGWPLLLVALGFLLIALCTYLRAL